jgi:hypothetical protein
MVCAQEGERPCPFCGELILSNETLNDPDRFERVVASLRERIEQEKWIPPGGRALEPAHVAPEVSTAMIDVDRDYFDAELLEISSPLRDEL